MDKHRVGQAEAFCRASQAEKQRTMALAGRLEQAVVDLLEQEAIAAARANCRSSLGPGTPSGAALEQAVVDQLEIDGVSTIQGKRQLRGWGTTWQTITGEAMIERSIEVARAIIDQGGKYEPLGIDQAEAFGRIVGLLDSLKDDPTIHRLGADKLMAAIWTIASAAMSAGRLKECQGLTRNYHKEVQRFGS